MGGWLAARRVRLGRSFLELKVEDAIPGMHDPVLVLCASGMRSLFAAESLLQLGYQDVRSVAGGCAVPCRPMGSCPDKGGRGHARPSFPVMS
ncbi:hypothetical protein B0E47_07760 [Rhodanobacter sp. B05]|uniref:rhodanese-like domain-containing protein n=1 Tax=Rhodanobacter sp. B05 TaxID=1945859 RepID=UPI0009848281|nr:hypothetical protein B0E47_07760 [Rhodanobacter sp. B05]